MAKKFLTIELITLFSTIIILSALLFVQTKTTPNVSEVYNKPKEPVIEEIILSFVGDCTIGTDDNFGYANTFTNVFDDNNGDFGYFFRGVKDILANDDLTIANLETTFTNANKKTVKKFNFKGPPSYVNILLEGSVEVNNIANNHTYDYLEQGYIDTLNVLDEANLDYYGYDLFLIKEVKGLTIGFAGFTTVSDIVHNTSHVQAALDYFEEQNVQLKIITFHWGIEKAYQFNKSQESLGKYAIDNGADLVIGHHPHVLQGIQLYNGKYIVYSLGNFVFGGNRHPFDNDAMIFQSIYTLKDGLIVDSTIKIIPVSVSSNANINDYQPTIVEGEKKDAIISKINQYSKDFIYE